MLRFQNKIFGGGQVSDSPFGERADAAKVEQAMTLLALSHTPLEQQMYAAMLAEVSKKHTRLGAFGTRDLMILTGLTSFGSIKRVRNGLLKKLSIERQETIDEGEPSRVQETVYRVFSPVEIFDRRRAAGLDPYPKDVEAHGASAAYGQAIERLLERHNLSRRETQVALCCAEGLTNAEIGKKLVLREQTVKFHLRHVYIKVGVRRRAELISRLLM